eukprot:gene12309-biopygen3360
MRCASRAEWRELGESLGNETAPTPEIKCSRSAASRYQWPDDGEIGLGIIDGLPRVNDASNSSPIPWGSSYCPLSTPSSRHIGRQ